MSLLLEKTTKPLYYLPSQNKFLGAFGIYSPEEVDEADRLEKEWQATQLKLSFYQLLEIFPQAKSAIKRNLTAEIKKSRNDLSRAHELYNEYTYKLMPRIPAQAQWFFYICRDFIVEELTKDREKTIKRNYFYLSALKPQPSISANGKITPQDIQRAREVPLDTFLTVNSASFAPCPFHEDKTPSLRVYKNTNRWYCFSCNSGTDVIDLYMKMNKCDFITAVKKLIRK
ncbi:MAG: CHC2 zinc finger domain-containing protein [Candidatus Levybacteria bacterium]|nr:CHC2 zinc finger domain-containing protein [Candidatus Levybacteria bacterium]